MNKTRIADARPAAHNAIDFGDPPKAPFLVVHSDDGDTEAIRDEVLAAIRGGIDPATVRTLIEAIDRLRFEQVIPTDKTDWPFFARTQLALAEARRFAPAPPNEENP